MVLLEAVAGGPLGFLPTLRRALAARLRIVEKAVVRDPFFHDRDPPATILRLRMADSEGKRQPIAEASADVAPVLRARYIKERP
jgi:hypothetical protein